MKQKSSLIVLWVSYFVMAFGSEVKQEPPKKWVRPGSENIPIYNQTKNVAELKKTLFGTEKGYDPRVAELIYVKGLESWAQGMLDSEDPNLRFDPKARRDFLAYKTESADFTFYYLIRLIIDARFIFHIKVMFGHKYLAANKSLPPKEWAKGGKLEGLVGPYLKPKEIQDYQFPYRG